MIEEESCTVYSCMYAWKFKNHFAGIGSNVAKDILQCKTKFLIVELILNSTQCLLIQISNQ